MKIALFLKESIYDCKIIITDSHGKRNYNISALHDEEIKSNSITVAVFDNNFSLTVIPEMTDTKTMLNEIEATDWKDKLAKTASSLLLNTLDKAVLLVGCDYRIMGLQDGDRLEIRLQGYVFDTFDRLDLLELLPMCYTFFEVAHFNNFCELTNAYETNRKALLKFAKSISLIQAFDNSILGFFTYPLQVSRIKHLSKNKKIFKTLTKFNSLSDVERQRLLEKQARIL